MSTLLSKIVADFTTQLATAISTGGTTATLESITDDDGVTLPNGQYLLTIDGNNSQKEYWLCTLTGTSLTAIQNVSRQGARTAGCIRDHRVGASVSITDFAHILYINNLLTGVTDLDENTPLKYAADPGITSSDLTSLATVQFVVDSTTAGAPDATNLVKGITKLSVAAVSPTDPIAVGDNDTRVPTQSENDAMAGTAGTPSSTNPFVTGDDTTSTPTADAVVRAQNDGKINPGYITTVFGGDGSDGALDVPSGTTILDAAGANILERNYTSINIAAGATLTISNPAANGTILYLRSQGDVTIDGTIDLEGDGAVGGEDPGSSPLNGLPGTNGFLALYVDSQNHFGLGGDVDGSNDDAGGGGGASSVTIGTTGTGAGSAIPSSVNPAFAIPLSSTLFNMEGRRILFVGSGGGSGAREGGVGSVGLGGRGGGGLYIEVGGELVFTGTINVSGQNGIATVAGSGSYALGGGGAGSGGMSYIYAKEITTNTGTVDITGGTGSNGLANGAGYSAGNGGNGGDGLSIIEQMFEI